MFYIADAIDKEHIPLRPEGIHPSSKGTDKLKCNTILNKKTAETNS